MIDIENLDPIDSWLHPALSAFCPYLRQPRTASAGTVRGKKTCDADRCPGDPRVTRPQSPDA